MGFDLSERLNGRRNRGDQSAQESGQLVARIAALFRRAASHAVAGFVELSLHIGDRRGVEAGGRYLAHQLEQIASNRFQRAEGKRRSPLERVDGGVRCFANVWLAVGLNVRLWLFVTKLLLYQRLADSVHFAPDAEESHDQILQSPTARHCQDRVACSYPASRE